MVAAVFLPLGLIEPIAFLGLPILRGIAQWVPDLTVGATDPLPLILAVVLFFVRPRITDPLARLEARWRSGSAAGHATW